MHSKPWFIAYHDVCSHYLVWWLLPDFAKPDGNRFLWLKFFLWPVSPFPWGFQVITKAAALPWPRGVPWDYGKWRTAPVSRPNTSAGRIWGLRWTLSFLRLIPPRASRELVQRDGSPAPSWGTATRYVQNEGRQPASSCSKLLMQSESY